MKIQEERSLKVFRIGLESNIVELFDPIYSNPKWSKIDPLEYQRKNFSVSLAYHRAIIIGGKGSYKLDLTIRELMKFHTLNYNEVISYDERTKKFSTEAFYGLIKPRHSHSSIVLKNKIGEDHMLYVFGGYIEEKLNC